MSQIFDFKDLEEFGHNCLNMAQKTMPKETRKFLNTEGYKLRRNVRKCGKREVPKVTGKYHKGWKKGKVYRYKGEKTSLAVRVYNSEKYAHILENGRKYKRKGKEYFKAGNHILERTTKDFKNEFADDISSFLDDVFDRF
ncbi:MAG: HK97 gp10 family phage protein [Oscillospiraceae bacterium]